MAISIPDWAKSKWAVIGACIFITSVGTVVTTWKPEWAKQVITVVTQATNEVVKATK